MSHCGPIPTPSAKHIPTSFDGDLLTEQMSWVPQHNFSCVLWADKREVHILNTGSGDLHWAEKQLLLRYILK